MPRVARARGPKLRVPVALLGLVLQRSDSAPGSASCRRSCPPSIAVSELWTSVEPTTPNLNGLTPSFASCSSPRSSPARVVRRHHRLVSGLSVRDRLPYSQPAMPKSSSSSLGEISGWLLARALRLDDLLQCLPTRAPLGRSPSSAPCRRSRPSRTCRPLERFALCAIARSFPPVFCS